MQSKDYPRLLDCPFCGGEAEIIKAHGQKIDTRTMPYRVALAVVCKNMECGANMGNWYERAEAVAAKWNRRAQPANEPLTLEQLREMDGEPVWVETPNKSKSEWVFVKQVRDNGDVRVRPDFHSCINLPYSKVRFYRCKPEQEGGDR